MNGTITVQNDPSAGGVVLGGTDISALSQGGWLNITAEVQSIIRLPFNQLVTLVLLQLVVDQITILH